ncbi:MAG: hypothetical protein LBR51_02425 [Bacteroidales bacterium]|jgi:hypothetical protein|nr:hypothetical protein [Bacteroidales bacterium]
MSKQEVSQLRVTILQGLACLSQVLLDKKRENNRLIAIAKDNRVQVIPAQYRMR